MEKVCAQAARDSKPSKAKRMAEHILAQLACLGTHTITGLLSTCGHQCRDWSADYRLYGRNRMLPERLFEPVPQWLCENQQGPIVRAMDDTRLRKSGTKAHGVKYMRDPMGPPFRLNFIRAQRFLQTSMACKGEVGAQRIQHMRAWLNEHGATERGLWTTVDGSFTNGTVLKALPENTTLVGRIRADAKLYPLPQEQPGKGRRRVYGDQAPTPEELRQDESLPWKHIEVFFGGRMRELRVKQHRPLRWRTAGPNHTLQLLVIAPTPYRLSKNSKLLYRKPAYLICTDADAPLQDVIQHHLWRWDIEANFRDEKTLLGLGDAQVRTPKAVQNVTGCAVAAYAMLLTAAAQCQKQNLPCDHLPAPKWQYKKSYRTTTMRLIQNLRYELWARSIHFSGFEVQRRAHPKPEKRIHNPGSALFYASSYF